MKFESQDYGLSANMSAKSAKNATPLIDALKVSIHGYIDSDAHPEYAAIPISDYKIPKPGTEDLLVKVSQTNFDLPKDLLKRCPLWTAPQLIDEHSSDHGLRLLSWLIMREMHYMIFFSQKLSPISFNKIIALMMCCEACDDIETQIAFKTMLAQLNPVEPKVLSKAEQAAIAIKTAGKKAAPKKATEPKTSGKKVAVAETKTASKKAEPKTVTKKAKAEESAPAEKKATPAKKAAAKKAKEPEPEPEPESEDEDEDEPEEVDSDEDEDEDDTV
jgi:hypothetical protein